MGCGGSKRGCCGENRPEELGKCAAVSPEVRWSWLRGHTLFTFSELRTVCKVFQEATSSELMQLGKLPPTSSTPVGGAGGGGGPGQATSRSSLWAPVSSPHVKSGSSSPAARMMDKAQFLALCDSDETFRLSVVVGAFGSRLFDVLDEDGDGRLGFEAFALGLSKLLKGPESERLKLMYAAYDLSGVAPSEERRKGSGSSVGGGSGSLSGSSGGSSGSSGGGGGGGGGAFGGGKSKAPRRSKYLTLEDMSAVLASASQRTYPTLLRCMEGANNNRYLSGTCGGGGGGGGGVGESKGSDDSPSARKRRGGSGRREAKSSAQGKGGRAEVSTEGGGGRRSGSGGGGGSGGPRGMIDPKVVEELLHELARRNAASYAARAVSEFGQVQDGALTLKEFEKWVQTGPVLRCRINEFSIDLNVAPFHGVRLA